MSPRPLALLPTYNERETLPAVLDLLLGAAGVDALVIDDGSPDGTGDWARGRADADPRVRVLQRPAPAGLGSAYRAGLALALAEGRPAAVLMDSDLSHDPRDVPRLLAPVLSGAADLAIGARIPPRGGSSGRHPLRLLVSRLGNAYARALLGLGSRDLTSGFRAYSLEGLRRADPAGTASEGFGFHIEMAWRIGRAGGRIVDVPILFADRRLGASKMSAGIALEAAWRLPLLRLRG